MKSIKTETTQKKEKQVPKNQVVLPKLESDVKVRQIRDIEHEMDAEMSRMMNEEFL